MLAERLGVDESVLSFRFYGPVNQNCVNYTYIVDIPTVTRVVISDETVSTRLLQSRRVFPPNAKFLKGRVASRFSS